MDKSAIGRKNERKKKERETVEVVEMVRKEVYGRICVGRRGQKKERRKE